MTRTNREEYTIFRLKRGVTLPLCLSRATVAVCAVLGAHLCSLLVGLRDTMTRKGKNQRSFGPFSDAKSRARDAHKDDDTKENTYVDASDVAKMFGWKDGADKEPTTVPVEGAAQDAASPEPQPNRALQYDMSTTGKSENMDMSPYVPTPSVTGKVTTTGPETAARRAQYPPTPHMTTMDGAVEDLAVRMGRLEVSVGKLVAQIPQAIQDQTQAPPWASQLQTSIANIDSNFAILQGEVSAFKQRQSEFSQVLDMHTHQLNLCQKNVHPIHLAEEAAKLATAHQSRISNFKQSENHTSCIPDYVKAKFPNFAVPTIETAQGGVVVASFGSIKQAKSVVKSLKEDKKHLTIRPELPWCVLDSQGPLKRAMTALSDLAKDAGRGAAPDVTGFKIDFRSRTIADGDGQIHAYQLADGGVTCVLGTFVTNEVASLVTQAAMNREFYRERWESRGLGKEGKPKGGNTGVEKGKGKGKGKAPTSAKGGEPPPKAART